MMVACATCKRADTSGSSFVMHSRSSPEGGEVRKYGAGSGARVNAVAEALKGKQIRNAKVDRGDELRTRITCGGTCNKTVLLVLGFKWAFLTVGIPYFSGV